MGNTFSRKPDADNPSADASKGNENSPKVDETARDPVVTQSPEERAQKWRNIPHHAGKNSSSFLDPKSLGNYSEVSMRAAEFTQYTREESARKNIALLLEKLPHLNKDTRESIISLEWEVLNQRVFEEMLRYLFCEAGGLSTLKGDALESSGRSQRLIDIANALVITGVGVKNRLVTTLDTLARQNVNLSFAMLGLAYICHQKTQSKNGDMDVISELNENMVNIERQDKLLCKALEWLPESNRLRAPDSNDILSDILTTLCVHNYRLSAQQLWQQVPEQQRYDLLLQPNRLHQYLPFSCACAYGHTDMAIWLATLIPDDKKSDVLEHSTGVWDFQAVFRSEGQKINGNLDLARLLWSMATKEQQACMLQIGEHKPKERWDRLPPFFAASRDENEGHMKFLWELVDDEQREAMISNKMCNHVLRVYYPEIVYAVQRVQDYSATQKLAEEEKNSGQEEGTKSNRP